MASRQLDFRSYDALPAKCSSNKTQGFSADTRTDAPGPKAEQACDVCRRRLYGENCGSDSRSGVDLFTQSRSDVWWEELHRTSPVSPSLKGALMSWSHEYKNTVLFGASCVEYQACELGSQDKIWCCKTKADWSTLQSRIQSEWTRAAAFRYHSLHTRTSEVSDQLPSILQDRLCPCIAWLDNGSDFESW